MAHVEWHGEELMMKSKRAVGRAAIGIAEQIVSEAKQIVHKQSGTLGRSIHAAAADGTHFDDEDLARSGLDLNEEESKRLKWEDVVTDLTALVEAGSWIAYACVEETGRQHHYMLPAYELVLPTWPVTIEAAFAEEGIEVTWS